MFFSRPAATADWPLERVIAELCERPNVQGLLAIGSTGRNERSEASDIDLVIVVEAGSEMPRLALTIIDGIAADVLFVQADEVKRWPESGGFESWPADTLGRWLHGGRIVFDRSGLLAEIQDRALQRVESSALAGAGHYSIWFSVNYNLAQNQRMAQSTDAVYRTALDLRLLYSLTDLWHAYFLLRDLPQRGEKDQIRHLQLTDPDYLRLFQSALAADDVRERLAVSAQLARRCLEPVGGVWPPKSACVLPLSGSAGADSVGDAWAEWDALFGLH